MSPDSHMKLSPPLTPCSKPCTVLNLNIIEKKKKMCKNWKFYLIYNFWVLKFSNAKCIWQLCMMNFQINAMYSKVLLDIGNFRAQFNKNYYALWKFNKLFQKHDFFYTHLGYSFNFTVVYLCQIKGAYHRLAEV